jgi:hypothetical protein
MTLIKVIISQLGTNWVQFPCKLIIKILIFVVQIKNILNDNVLIILFV